jgi:DNA repair protein RadA/Sms
MTYRGLIAVENPSEMLLAGRPIGESGTIVVSAIEGSRPVMVEVQALVSPTSFGNPKRLTTGVDYNRVSLLMAVLEKRIGLQAQAFDAYVNITGGIQMKEPALDLGIVVALVSSYKDKAVDGKIVVAGEVGLAGEIRTITNLEKRISEAEKLGFDKIYIPKSRFELPKNTSIEIVEVSQIGELITKIFGR